MDKVLILVLVQVQLQPSQYKSTFANCSVWLVPNLDIIFVVGGIDRVHCAFCGFSHESLEDDIISLHSRLSPSCPHLTGHGNQGKKDIPDTFTNTLLGCYTSQTESNYNMLGISNNMAKYPELGPNERRVQTFLTYSSPINRTTTTDIAQFADAGYFFDGKHSIYSIFRNGSFI